MMTTTHRLRIRCLLVLTLLLSLATARAANGVEYKSTTEAGPVAIYLVAFDLARRDLALQATVGAGLAGIDTVPDLVAALPKRMGTPLAAINGDYFEYKTEPRYLGTLAGLCIADGELIANPANSAFYVKDGKPVIARVQSAFTLTWPGGQKTAFALNCSTADYKSEVRAAPVVLFTPRFGDGTHTQGVRELVLGPVDAKRWLPLRPNQTLQARVVEIRTDGNTPLAPGRLVVSLAHGTNAPAANVGDTLTISTTLTPDLTGVRTAVAGDPLLVSDGQVVPNLDDANRAPRSAIGISGSKVIMVAVDGRQPRLSIGLTHRGMADLMRRNGCMFALNLDGGGSTTLWYGGNVMNSPSDGKLRPVGQALILVRTKGK